MQDAERLIFLNKFHYNKFVVKEAYKQFNNLLRLP